MSSSDPVGVIATPLDHVTPLTEGMLMMVWLRKTPETVRNSSRQREIFLHILSTTLACRRKIPEEKWGFLRCWFSGHLTLNEMVWEAATV